MAKLSTDLVEKTEKVEGGSFEPLAAGAYHVRLMNVDTSKSGPSGPYWSWEFDVIGESGKLWTNTSLSEKALWKLKETFDAFGVAPDTDTDELCGKVCKAIVKITTIQQGNRKGDLTNEIDKLLPADEDFEDSGADTPDSEDIFS